jgi:hypothetical protein
MSGGSCEELVRGAILDALIALSITTQFSFQDRCAARHLPCYIASSRLIGIPPGRMPPV